LPRKVDRLGEAEEGRVDTGLTFPESYFPVARDEIPVVLDLELCPVRGACKDNADPVKFKARKERQGKKAKE